MKTRQTINIFILSFILGFSCLQKTRAQSYIPMINNSLYWDVTYAVNDPNPCAYFGAPKRYMIGNDTVFNGITYKQMHGYDFHPFTPAPCPPYYVDTIQQTFDFYIREDTIGKKVYRFNTTSFLDELLFDFSLQQHDSLYLPGSTNIYFYVDSLYTIITNDGISRKYFECFPRPNQGTTGGYYIEGLGGAMGPFERPYNLFEEGYWVLCISDLNEFSIFGTTSLCYNFTTGLTKADSRDQFITIYPVPSSENIQLENIPRGSSFTIMNMLGEVIKNKEILIASGINISNLKSGVYFVLIETGKEIRRGTFVKN